MSEINTNEKGHLFEEKVAKWAKHAFNNMFSKVISVERNVELNGDSCKRPWEIDILVTLAHREFLFGNVERHIMIECKDQQANINRDIIGKMILEAIDIEMACKKKKEKLYFDELVMVSTSPFNSDALNFASDNPHYQVACFLHKNNDFYLENEIEWSL